MRLCRRGDKRSRKRLSKTKVHGLILQEVAVTNTIENMEARKFRGHRQLKQIK